MLRLALRNAGNALLRKIPEPALRMLLKGFATQPEFAERIGFQVLLATFWSAAPIAHEIDRPRLLEARALPGLSLRRPEALHLLQQFIAESAAEIAAIPRDRSPACPLWLSNGTYEDFDAATLYAMLRHLRPRRYVEVGCGFSTRASTLALARNAAEGVTCESQFVEPFPSENLLEQKLPGEFHRVRIQEAPLSLFTSLQAGDVLFIDTSHVLKTQSDVEYELLRILPVLAPGVWIHIHDIFSPYDYPEEWVCGKLRGGNNEQYALECLLSGGSRFQVELPVYALWREERATLDRLCANTTARPAAFWIRRTSAA